MSMVHVEPAAVGRPAEFSADSIRIVVPAEAERAFGSRPALGNANAMRLSVELSAVIAHWLALERWRHGIPPSRPLYRRNRG